MRSLAKAAPIFMAAPICVVFPPGAAQRSNTLSRVAGPAAPRQDGAGLLEIIEAGMVVWVFGSLKPLWQVECLPAPGHLFQRVRKIRRNSSTVILAVLTRRQWVMTFSRSAR